MSKFINRIRSINYIEYILLATIISLGFFMRLYKIDNPVADWHSFRQADTASVTRIYVQKGIDLLYPRYHDVSTTQSGLSNPEGYRFVEFPVYSALHALLYINYPVFSLEVWGRLLSIIFSLFSSFFVFLIARKYASWKEGLFASALFLFLPFNIYFSRVILPEPLAVCLGMSALWFFVKYIDEKNIFYLVISSLLSSMALLVKPYMVFYLLPMALLAIQKEGLKAAILNKKYWFYALIVIIPFFLWRYWMNQFPEGIPFWKWTFNGDGIRFKPAFWKWIFGERLTKLILGYWGVIPFVFGILSFKKKDLILYSFLFGCFIYVSVFATANVRHDYYQALIIPAVCLTVAYGISEMWNDQRFGKFRMKTLLFFSLFMIITASYSEVKEFYKINRPEIIEAGNAVKTLVPENALVIAPYYGDTAFLYQTQRRGWPVVDRPINELIEKGARYLVSVDLNHYQTLEFEKKYQTLIKKDKFIILDLTKESI